MRRLFAFVGVQKRYGDFSPTVSEFGSIRSNHQKGLDYEA
jgi:hypothetical protein